MPADRLEVRLDPERKRKLAELAQERRMALSDLVRQMIDRTYEERLRERRLQAARELAALAIEDVPDPETLKRQLESAHDPGVP